MTYCCTCRDPLEAVPRILDALRRLGLALKALQIESCQERGYAVRFALSLAEPDRVNLFANRFDLLSAAWREVEHE
ncbi:MAG: hypothetical protein GC186_08920 [Rhodobacteraceae bacterium]|nr:hypothetical protein [Paracoccaceae bacterium]